jgi:putative endonuclease
MDDEGGAHVYMLPCSDGRYYVGSARRGLDRRVAEHNSGKYGGYTSKLLPVVVVWAEHFPDVTDAIAVERQIKGWSRAKKEALIDGDYETIKQLARRGG